MGGARGGRGGRPDALVEDKVSNRPVNRGYYQNSGFHGGQSDGYHGGQSDGYYYGANGYQGNSGGNYNGHYDVNQAQGYPGQHDGNHGYPGQQDGNHGYPGKYHGNHGYPNASGESYSYPPSYQPPSDQLQLPPVTCPSGMEPNQTASTASGRTEHGPNQTPCIMAPAGALSSVGPSTQAPVTVTPEPALSSVCEDMWDMRISLHTNDALS